MTIEKLIEGMTAALEANTEALAVLTNAMYPDEAPAPKAKGRAKAKPAADEEDDEDEPVAKPKSRAKAKPATDEEDEDEDDEPATKPKGRAKTKPDSADEEDDEEDDEEEDEADGEVTRQDVAKRITYWLAKDRAKLVKALAQFKVKRGQDLKETQLGKFLAVLDQTK